MNRCRLIVLALLMGALPAHNARAQDAYSEQAKVKLARKVHLTLGEATAAQVASALSKQTGLAVIVSDYLREHKLIVQMDGLSARTVLNALADLNDWTWRETQPEHILLARRELRVPQQVSSIPRLIQAALPSDIRTYLGIPTPTDDLNRIYRLQDKDYAALLQRKGKAKLAAPAEENALIDSLNLVDVQKVPLTYAKMTPQQRENLLRMLVLTGLSATNIDMFRGDLLPFIADPADAEIELWNQGKTLAIGSHSQRGDTRSWNGSLMDIAP